VRAQGCYTSIGRQAWSHRAVAEIQAFITTHEDGLFEADYRAMLEAELTRKKPRGTVVKGLKALIGGDE
jgi:hypothetical protein